MANTIVEIQLPTVSPSPTLSLYALGSTTLANSDGADTLAEETNALGFWRATVTEALAGIYRVKVLSGGAVLATGYIYLADDTDTYYVCDSYAEAAIGKPVNAASIGLDIDAVYDRIGSAGAGLTAVPWNAAWDAEAQSEVNDGLVALGLDHMVSASVTGTDITDNSIIAKLASKSATADWDDFNNTTDSLQAISDTAAASGASASSIADAVWDEARSGHTTAGTFGFYLDAAITGVGGATGSGADTVTLTIVDGSANPVADAAVWITSDADGDVVVAGTLYTNASGEVEFLLDAGDTYYAWRQKVGVNFTNPVTFVAVAD